MFQIQKLEGDWWAVFLVHPHDPKDRYMLTSPLTKKEAEHFWGEFDRIFSTWHFNQMALELGALRAE